MRRRARIVQIVRDFSRKPLSDCRVLDLACLEGDFAAELAMRGAQALGIEGRASNIERGRARHPMKSLQFTQDDVRNLSREKYGQFDIVLCLGILYHLDAPECFKLLRSIAEVCTGFAVIDTHVSLTPNTQRSYDGRTYSGSFYTEYERRPSSDEQERKVWAAIDNCQSFWPSKPSLVNAVIDAGFVSAYECQYPAWNDIPADRVALVALKGEREKVLSENIDDALYHERLDETPRVPPVLGGDVRRGLLSRLAALATEKLRRM